MNWKQAIGWLIWQAGSRSVRARARLTGLGMRTRQDWYRDRVAPVELYGGRRVWLTHLDENYLSFQLFWQSWRHFEPLTTALLAELLRERRVFLDIGANIGYYSLTAAGLFHDLQVVAFEPNPKLARILRRNIAHNGLAIHVEQLAISDQSGNQVFYVPTSDMSGSLSASFNADIEHTIDVRAIRLDDHIAATLADMAVPGAMVIKIDTEGHEPAVLRGASQTLARARPDLILEVTDDFDQDSQDRLRELGYRFYPITDHGLQAREQLTVCRRGALLFLNTLVSARPPAEIAQLGQNMCERVSTIDLTRTSLYRPDR